MLKEMRVAVISHKIDFKTKAITKDKAGHYIVIKGSIQGDAKDKTKQKHKPETLKNFSIAQQIIF